mmetsp:Transcript_8305/g.16402  ORF Transcript_8305/g.16402 Transcript_8305/m.16402 type:complete len:195 (+) Transcript_8305:158-742(+)
MLTCCGDAAQEKIGRDEPAQRETEGLPNMAAYNAACQCSPKFDLVSLGTGSCGEAVGWLAYRTKEPIFVRTEELNKSCGRNAHFAHIAEPSLHHLYFSRLKRKESTSLTSTLRRRHFLPWLCTLDLASEEVADWTMRRRRRRLLHFVPAVVKETALARSDAGGACTGRLQLPESPLVQEASPRVVLVDTSQSDT